MKLRYLLVITFCVLLSVNCFGQTPLIYTEVVNVDSVSKSDLYNRAILWFATTYNNSKEVLQLEDKTEGQVVGQAVLPYNQTFIDGSARTKGNIKYSIKIFLKDGRYKYEISDFIHDPIRNDSLSFGLITTDIKSPIQHKWMFSGWNDKVWADIKRQINRNIIPLIASLKESMAKKAESKNNDW